MTGEGLFLFSAEALVNGLRSLQPHLLLERSARTLGNGRADMEPHGDTASGWKWMQQRMWKFPIAKLRSGAFTSTKRGF